ncbi:peptidase U62 modulator of DNA gyrase [Acidimicrobium ferrooxidans DSM 10331]|uniref:Peptidase U62 modulator of DNA gyrase n=1 Tax=Acidimicrobium ferrooxidans (strain DSM 10331 / JCM 15462 / NBRC 103882 / ICP) TaxID=525909 RepID=C7M345_ACIFD|nr:TldD/PmbA family protein [Acidimicrobium ferrooxidans]ACU53439.1 peptidase U62 modulator of DNA gyrase [Acidimicrobium ferrooxidans DSM 10331]
MIDPELVDLVLQRALARGGDFAEVFVEEVRSTSVSVDDGRVGALADVGWRGVGIRVVVGETTGFAHTTDLSPRALVAAAETASSIAKGGASRVAPLEVAPIEPAAPERDPSAKRRMVELLRAGETEARGLADAIVQVSGQAATARRRILVANSEGRFVTDRQARTRVSFQVVAAGDTGAQSGRETSAATVDLEELLDALDVGALAQVAGRRALAKLAARPAPAGVLPVVLAKGSGGILFHEACGHGLEADHIAKGASVYAGRLGERVASPLVTLVDDGTRAGEWGSYHIDDEGNPAQSNVLIRDGELVDYLWDRRSATKLGQSPRGNGRRQDYRSLPMVRMTNTFLTPGESDPADVVASTDHGVYVAALSGGQVNTATGDFVFGVQEAYLIEHGRITAPIRDTQLIGNGPEVLAAVDAVANDFDMTAGTCGKNGQSVPVGCGQPTLRLAGVTLGGTIGG